MEWIRCICFFISALVLSLAMLILNFFYRKLKGHGRTREKTKLIRRIFSLAVVVSPGHPGQKKMLKNGVSIPVDLCISFRTIPDNPT